MAVCGRRLRNTRNVSDLRVLGSFASPNPSQRGASHAKCPSHNIARHKCAPAVAKAALISYPTRLFPPHCIHAASSTPHSKWPRSFSGYEVSAADAATLGAWVDDGHRTSLNPPFKLRGRRNHKQNKHWAAAGILLGQPKLFNVARSLLEVRFKDVPPLLGSIAGSMLEPAAELLGSSKHLMARQCSPKAHPFYDQNKSDYRAAGALKGSAPIGHGTCTTAFGGGCCGKSIVVACSNSTRHVGVKPSYSRCR